MDNRRPKIKTFTDLNAWQEGHKPVLTIYKTTEGFPKKETFELTGQMRRAATSVTSNIAEGFSKLTVKDKCRFCSVAYGSLTELQNHLFITRDVGYINKNKFQEIAQQTVIVGKLINGLKRIKGYKILNT